MRRLAFFTVYLIFSTSRILALDSTSRISQYGHTVWRVQDGYFGSQPYTIAQTSDGYIWVGTRDGLFRFDGVRFVRWSAQPGEALPSSSVVSLLAARDGSLWIGTGAGLAHMMKGHLFVYPKGDGQVIAAILEDREGRIWTSHNSSADKTHPLCQALEAELRCYGKEDGVDGFGDGPLAQDASGAIWVGSNTTLVEWRLPGSPKIYRPSVLGSNEGPDGIGALAAAPDGTLWVGMALPGRGAGLQHMVAGVLKPFSEPKLNGETITVTALVFDRQNTLWVGTTHGVYRVRGADIDHFGETDGLSGDLVLNIFEDREGNVWTVTSQGIDLFRDLRVRSVSKREGLKDNGIQSVAASRNGSLWIGTSELEVLGQKGEVSQLAALRGHQVTCLLEDHDGRLWAGIDNKLAVYERGSFHQVSKRDGSPLGMVAGMTEDPEGNIWIESVGPPAALMRIRDLMVQEEFPVPKMPLSRKIVADPRSGIWLGLVNGNLARYRSGQLSTFSFGEHPNSRVNAIAVASDGSILGATAFGVLGWKDGKQGILTERNGLPCNGVYALISDDQGNQWLFAQCGLIEIPKSEMSLWWEHPESRLKLRVFDALDGVQPGFGNFSNSAKTPDGRLWFANGNVLQVIDPAHLDANPLPPPVRIERITADGKAYDTSSGLQLPPRVRDVMVDYTALSFAVPQKVHFRYKLEGQDEDWREVVNDRRVQYSNLAPKKYRFRVMASNSSGVWNEDGASLDFSIAPAYYQTNWFRALCVAMFVALLWAVYELRLRQIRRQFNVGMEVRLKERTRIARELHDTLLQNLHGLLFRFQAARNLFPRRPEEAMETLDEAIAKTEQAITESQDAITDLRPPAASSDLGELLMATGKELETTGNTNGNATSFALTVEGEQQSLSPALQDEVYRIALELLRNAFRHACARRVEAEVRYDHEQLRVVIRDNGKGMDPEVMKRGRRPGHWGLLGAKERAQRIGARLDIWSEAGAGTEIQISIPAAVAYKNSHDRPKFSLFRGVRS